MRSRVSVVPSPFEILIGRRETLRLHDIPLIRVMHDEPDGADWIAKRAFDVVAATLLSVVVLLPMRGRVATLRGLVRRIRTRVPVIQEASRQRLQNRVSRLVAGIEMDAARVVQEIGTLVERGDVTEELVRLDSHLGALGAAVKEAGPAGKRIEFLLQEVLRELNTTGAKTADAGINGWVLAGKAEVEKLREQVQNVE